MCEPARVVVTGMGVVSALGFDDAALWRNMSEGKCGIGLIKAFDTTEYRTKVGSEVDNDQLAAALQALGLVSSDRTVDMALVASAGALKQSGLLADPPQPQNIAAIFGTGVGASQSLYNSFLSFSQKGVKGLRPTSVPRCMANSISAQVSMKFRLTGPNYVIVSACTSATNAIGTAFRMIREGYAQRVLCGGADTAFDPFVFGGWNNLGVMSKNVDPLAACRPFDSSRDGCVLGEGAAALVIESVESARSRGARIRAEIAGFGESSDAEHITSPSAEGQARAMNAAIACAGMTPDRIGFINAHGTATKANDECESRSVGMVLGDSAASVPVSANKSYFGHLLGASGAIETVVTILCIENRMLPSNLGLEKPDPACNLMLAGKEPMRISRPVAMKNSFGFGGDNAVLVIEACEET